MPISLRYSPHSIFSRYLKNGRGQQTIFLQAPKKRGEGNILDNNKRVLFVVTPWNFCAPLGSLRTPGLHCHPGTFAYNCPGLLEDDLGIQCPGKSCITFVTVLSFLGIEGPRASGYATEVSYVLNQCFFLLVTRILVFWYILVKNHDVILQGNESPHLDGLIC